MVDWLGDEVGDWLAPIRGVLEFLGMPAGKNMAMTMLISILWSDFSQFSRVCEYAAKDDYGDFIDWLMAMLLGGTEYEHDTTLPVLNITLVDGTTYSFEYNTPSKPTSSEHADSDWPFEGYGILAAGTSVTQDMITAQVSCRGCGTISTLLCSCTSLE